MAETTKRQSTKTEQKTQEFDESRFLDPSEIPSLEGKERRGICSFCGADHRNYTSEERLFIAGPRFVAFICEVCVSHCMDLLVTREMEEE